MTATSLDLSAIKTDALSAASTFRTLIGLGSSATLNAGSANGVATLGADSKLTAAQIPDISLISYLGSVASQAAMLALSGQQGDWCVRSDLSTTWVITGSDPTQIGSWTQLSYPSVPVQSVFGRTGAVVGVSTDYSSVGITNTAIGASNPSTGAFTTLSASSATLSAGTLNGTVLDIAQTWGGTGTYTGLKYNVTDSGPSNAASLLMDLQVGGASRFKVSKAGDLIVANPSVIGAAYFNGTNYTATGSNPGLIKLSANNISFMSPGGVIAGSTFNWSSLLNINFYEIALLTGVTASQGIQCEASNSFKWASQSTWGSPDLFLFRDAANTLAQRNSTNAQTFRIYNTYTDATNNFERGKIGWSGGVFQIGTEKGLTSGAARALELQTDGTTRLTIEATSGVTVINKSQFGSGGNNGNYVASINGRVLLRTASGSGVNVGYIGNYAYWTGVGTSENLTYASYQPETHFFTNSQYVDGEQALILKSTEVVLGKNTTCNGNLTLSTKNLVTDTTTGTKIGTATTQKLGFYNATPVVQPTAVADATDAASVITQLNLLLARMRDLGLIAT